MTCKWTIEDTINGLEGMILSTKFIEHDFNGVVNIEACEQAIDLLKAQEQEISRLKHHIDCEAAEKLPSGCVGYGRGFSDDEPCETCKACEKYNGYGEE